MYFEKNKPETCDLYSPKVEHILNSLDGSVYSQGVKIGHREWLDMGCVDYTKTPEKDKAAAYQASQVTGWDDERLKDLMLKKYEHIQPHIMDTAIEILKDLASKYPIAVEKSTSGDIDVPVTIKRRNNSS